MNEKNETWYCIPGFLDYEVSSAYRVRRVNGKKVFCRNKEYSLRRDKIAYSICAPRLLYAALHDIDPTELKRVLVVDVKGELVIMTRSEYATYVNASVRKPGLNKTTSQEYYKKAIRFAQMVLSYYETNDISEITGELLKYEGRIKAYIREAKYSTCDEVVNEAWHSVLANVLSYISDGKASILEPYNYLRRGVRIFFSTMRQHKKGKIRFSRIEERFNIEQYEPYGV